MGAQQNGHADAGDNKVRDAPNDYRVLQRLSAPETLTSFQTAKIPSLSLPFQFERGV